MCNSQPVHVTIFVRSKTSMKDAETRGVAVVPGLLVLDASYSLEIIRERGLEASVTCRDLNGYFNHVWSVHPFATLVTSEQWAAKSGKPVSQDLNERHTFIEGKVGRFRWLERLFGLNFLVGQIGLFVMLARLIRREQIAIIRVGDPLYLGLMGWALSRLSGIPLVIRVNGNNDRIRKESGEAVFPRLFRKRGIEEVIERFVFKRAQLVAAPNQDNVDYAVAYGADPEAVTIFGYGNLIAPEHLLDPVERQDNGYLDQLDIEKGRYLLCIGRLEPVKFPDDTILVLEGLVKRGFDIKLVLAGDGHMRDALTALARARGVSDRVIFVGNQNQTQLAQLIPNAAVVLSPLTGRSLTEAAFGAAPIAAYDLDWQGDLIETGVTGELVPFREIERFVDSAARLLEDPDYAAAMGRAVRQRALEMLSPDRLNAHEREQYTALLERQQQR